MQPLKHGQESNLTNTGGTEPRSAADQDNEGLYHETVGARILSSLLQGAESRGCYPV